mmetsp:Transcript_25511/g.61349  ORF Transcript_25511/g.61349 Transcript_25511/m.61349 type:complete len:93 (+) Transcript_25511:1499-1777(+)
MVKVSDRCQEAHNRAISKSRQFVTVIRHAMLNLVLGDMRCSREESKDRRNLTYRLEYFLFSEWMDVVISCDIFTTRSYKSDVVVNESLPNVK